MKNHIDRKRKNTNDKKRNVQMEVLEPAELMTFLINEMNNYSRSKIKSLLTHGQVFVDGKAISQYNHMLRPGQVVNINSTRPTADEEDMDLDILYEDDELIIIDKPSGLLTIATDTIKQNTAYRQLMNYIRKSDINNRIFIVHRLDRDTSGILLFAKNEKIQQLFQNEWQELVDARIYIAVVEGTINKNEDTITSWLLETKTKLMYSSSNSGNGQKAITHYKVLKTTDKYSLVEIQLETGRKNQIRVHMKDIGHSIIGDKKYGSVVNPIGRLALHAQTLTFNHPITNKQMHFQTNIPNEFSKLFK